MNDRHPSGTMAPAPASDAPSAPYASYGTQEAQYGDFTAYGGHDTAGFAPTGFGTGGHTLAGFDADPLFGGLQDGGHDTGAYGTPHWPTGGQDTTQHDTTQYDAYAAQQYTGYETGAYDATAWTTGQQHVPLIPAQGTAPDTGGEWDAGAWLQPDQSGNPADQTQQWDWGTQAFDTGAYDATQWNPDGDAAAASDAYGSQADSFDQQATAAFERFEDPQAPVSSPSRESGSPVPKEQDPYDDPALDGSDDTGELPAPHLLEEQQEVLSVPSPRTASRGGSRSRRRPPPKRSALLTVAVPSVCVMGVAGIAAASVSDLTEEGGQETVTTAADAPPVKPSVANIKLDTQLEGVAAGADDFADRASRTQERIDLKAQQEAERKQAAEEAARKERLRPKFALPVAQHGLSAYYGQSGINWMSVHSGIDFPVSYGTPVLAVTDGTVRTQYNSAYGNMVILTAMDGTETWYCHLSSYQVPSGTTVKAGDQIALSGNSGNSTGPHLHFEVRPGGGSAIDPLAWLRSHGLNPT